MPEARVTLTYSRLLMAAPYMLLRPAQAGAGPKALSKVSRGAAAPPLAVPGVPCKVDSNELHSRTLSALSRPQLSHFCDLQRFWVKETGECTQSI
jgi:hypothetical protein